MRAITGPGLVCIGVAALAAPALADVTDINSVRVVERVFNDFPSSTLVTTNNYPSMVQFHESNFGSGNFANRHSAYFSADGGATARDFNYGDAFDISMTVDLDATPPTGREAGFHTDLFGFGFFGVLPNGEIAAFGSVLPFHTFGNVWTPGQEVTLRMIHRPGDGDGVNPPPTTMSTIEYIYDLGSGPVSSGPIAMTGTEGGIPSNFNFYIGMGVQNQGGPGGESVATFTNITVAVPAPGAAALLGLAGLAATRRRR